VRRREIFFFFLMKMMKKKFFFAIGISHVQYNYLWKRKKRKFHQSTGNSGTKTEWGTRRQIPTSHKKLITRLHIEKKRTGNVYHFKQNVQKITDRKLLFPDLKK
jgi:hypothetical protein